MDLLIPSSGIELLGKERSTILAILTISFIVYWIVLAPSDHPKVDVPTIKLISPLLPESLSRLLFNSSAATAINAGYRKYKDRAYKVLTANNDLVVLSSKYAEELRQLPATTLNAIEATFSDHVGDYTTILLDSYLHTETIQKRLTPAIARLVPRLIDELNYGFEVEVPECKDEWVVIRPYEVFLRLVARSGARVFVGEEICRQEEWLSASIDFTKDIFLTIGLLRPVPKFLHPIVGPLLPSSRRLDRQLKHIQKELLGPMIQKRREMEASGNHKYQKPDDFLQWMMDLARNDNEGHSDNLAHRLLGITSMAVVHTSAMAMTHVLYDLINMPQWLEPLRVEIKSTIPDWKSASHADLLQLKRLDSLLKESQRFNPPGELSFHRIVKKDLVLSDGLELPQGSHICMAAGPISMDSQNIEDPDTYDAFRYYKEDKLTSNYVNTSSTSLHFGMGRYACPGRFFAVAVLKCALSRLLIDYDFKFGNGQTDRPKNMVLGDKIIPNFTTDIYIRKRNP